MYLSQARPDVTGVTVRGTQGVTASVINAESYIMYDITFFPSCLTSSEAGQFSPVPAGQNCSNSSYLKEENKALSTAVPWLLKTVPVGSVES